MILKLHLKGLERFQLRAPELDLTAHVSSYDRTVRIEKGPGNEQISDPTSDHWLTVNSHQDLKEITLPRALLIQNPKSFTVEWIDFYRN